MRWCAASVRRTTAPIAEMAQPNCNDQIAARAFGCNHHYDHVDNPLVLFQYDVVFVTMWKVKQEWESRWMDIAHRLCDAGKKVVLFQEAETAWPTTRSFEEQKSFIELLGKVDLFLTHNERDIHFWGALRGGKPTMRWRTCLDVEAIKRFIIEPDQKLTQPIIFGSSYDQRANGLAGLIACRGQGYPLWHQNRSVGYEDRNEQVPQLLGVKIDKEIPHLHWQAWLREISGAYLAVHPMPAAAAGRDQIAFAALGIPCIGNGDLDIQRELFLGPTRCDPFNVKEMRACVTALMTDQQTYDEVRMLAMQHVHHYGLTAADNQANLIKGEMGWL